jgi:hypothetical protein
MMVGTAGSEACVVRAGAWPVVARLGGPGRLDPYNPTSALLFDSSLACFRGDPLAAFFDSEVEALDWLTDYLMDDSILACEQDRGPNFSLEEEDVEEHYEKKALTTTESDTGWDIT